MSTAPASDAEPRLADPAVPRPAMVHRRRRDGPDVWTLEVESPVPAPEEFAPGQFNMLSAFGVGEAPVSLSGDPGVRDRLTHTVRAVGPVSRALAALRPGEVLGLRGPFGTGWPMAAAAGCDVVVVAGGLGLAPLRPALYRLMAERERYGRVVVLYGARSPEEILFRRELETWRRRLDVDVTVTVDHAAGPWHGHVGVVTTLLPRADFDPLQAVAFVCGPEVMMRFAVTALLDAGLEDGAIHLSLERNMKCAIGWCGHCQLGPVLVCRDGPVFRYDRVRELLAVREL